MNDGRFVYRKFTLPKVKGWMIFVGVLVAVWLPQYVSLFDIRGTQIEACERQNTVRDSELDQRNALVAVNVVRVQATSGQEREANQYALDQYRQSRDELIQSQEDVAVKPGSVVADCDSIYEKPFPFNI
jgi:hypothetical protein